MVSGFDGSPLAAYSCGGSPGFERANALAPDSRFTLKEGTNVTSVVMGARGGRNG